MIEITIEKIKKSLLDHKFRKMYPELTKEIDQYINNPGCKCNIPLYNTILGDINKLKKYFGEDIAIIDAPIAEQPEQVNRWQIVNCHINELQKVFDELPHGPKQIAIARWEDQCTVIINDPIFN